MLKQIGRNHGICISRLECLSWCKICVVLRTMIWNLVTSIDEVIELIRNIAYSKIWSSILWVALSIVTTIEIHLLTIVMIFLSSIKPSTSTKVLILIFRFMIDSKGKCMIISLDCFQ